MVRRPVRDNAVLAQARTPSSLVAVALGSAACGVAIVLVAGAWVFQDVSPISWPTSRVGAARFGPSWLPIVTMLLVITGMALILTGAVQAKRRRFTVLGIAGSFLFALSLLGFAYNQSDPGPAVGIAAVACAATLAVPSVLRVARAALAVTLAACMLVVAALVVSTTAALVNRTDLTTADVSGVAALADAWDLLLRHVQNFALPGGMIAALGTVAFAFAVTRLGIRSVGTLLGDRRGWQLATCAVVLLVAVVFAVVDLASGDDGGRSLVAVLSTAAVVAASTVWWRWSTDGSPSPERGADERSLPLAWVMVAPPMIASALVTLLTTAMLLNSTTTSAAGAMVVFE